MRADIAHVSEIGKNEACLSLLVLWHQPSTCDMSTISSGRWPSHHALLSYVIRGGDRADKLALQANELSMSNAPFQTISVP